MITLLNTSILTTHGASFFAPLTLTQVKMLCSTADIQSAVGHQATADILTELLDIPVAINRIEYRQLENDLAIVFKLKGRPPEGKVLSREEVEEIGFDFGVIVKFDPAKKWLPVRAAAAARQGTVMLGITVDGGTELLISDGEGTLSVAGTDVFGIVAEETGQITDILLLN